MNWQLLSLIPLLFSFLLAPAGGPGMRRAGEPVVANGPALQSGTAFIPKVEVRFPTTSVGLKMDHDLKIGSGGSRTLPLIVEDGGTPEHFLRSEMYWLDTNSRADSVILPITYRPLETGEHRLLYLLRWDSTGGSDSVEVWGTANASISIRQPGDSGNVFNDTIDFAPTAVGSCDTVWIEIDNNSGSDQHVSITGAVTLTSRPFSRGEPGPVRQGSVLVPMGITRMPVSFCAEDVFPHSDSLTITTSFGYRTFVLRARGVGPAIDVVPRIVRFAGTGTCRRDIVTIRNSGLVTLRVTGLRILLNDSARFRVTSTPPTFTSPFLIEPGGSRMFEVEYCGVSTNDSAAIEVTSNAIFDSVTTLQLHPLFLAISPPVLDFGDVEIDSCAERELLITNLAETDDTITSIAHLVGVGGVISTDTVAGSALPLIVPAGLTGRFIVRYCPRTVGPLAGVSYARSANGDTVAVAFRARAIPKPLPPAGRIITLDSTAADAGSMLLLRASISPALPVATGPRDFELQLRFDPAALYPVEGVDPVSGEAWTLTRSSTDRGTVLLRNRSSRAVADRLVEIRFRGLSTGQDRNLVSIERVVISGLSITAGPPGLVELRGCDIGKVTGLDRRATIRGLSVDGAKALLRFIAPEGSIAQLTLTAVDGTAVRSIALPVTTAGEQSVPVDLQGVPPGFYILDLRVGDGRSSIPLMIAW